jgi:nucleoside-diphosphate-sugar epimerase
MLVCKAGYKPVDFDDYNATTFYGESKVFTEKCIKNNTSIRSEWNIVRPTSIWGPWFGSPYRNFFDMILQNRYVNIKGGTTTKTFGFVENAVFQINEILFSEPNLHNKEVFYIGDRPPINISVWANEILYNLNKKPALALPFFMFKILALIGDFLSLLGVSFPMSSFRLKNMTTDNIQNLENTYSLTGEPPINRNEGIIKTLEWISSRDNL